MADVRGLMPHGGWQHEDGRGGMADDEGWMADGGGVPADGEG
jgi:hypothetical protein